MHRNHKRAGMEVWRHLLLNNISHNRSDEFSMNEVKTFFIVVPNSLHMQIEFGIAASVVPVIQDGSNNFIRA